MRSGSPIQVSRDWAGSLWGRERSVHMHFGDFVNAVGTQ